MLSFEEMLHTLKKLLRRRHIANMKSAELLLACEIRFKKLRLLPKESVERIIFSVSQHRCMPPQAHKINLVYVPERLRFKFNRKPINGLLTRRTI